MAYNILKHRKHKIGLGILVAVIAVVLVLAYFINQYWSPILAKKVRDVVLTSSDSLYKADFSDAELHVLRGTIVLYNITLKPDTAVYNRRLKQHTAPNNLVELHVKKLVLDHIHPFRLYFKHELKIDDIILSAPELNVSYALNQKNDTVRKDHRTVWQKMSQTLHSIQIHQIFLNDVKLKYNDYSGNKVAISELKEMNLSAYDLRIDSATQTDTSRILYCKDIVTELNNYKGESPSGLYTYKIKHLKISTLTSQLNIEGLSLEPVNKDSFFDRTRKDRFTLRLDSVQLNHFDYVSYHKYRRIKAANMILHNGTFALFNNPNRQIQSKIDKAEGFPAAVLIRLSTNVTVDTVSIKHLNIAYSEYNKKAYQTGSITFNDTYGTFLNVTNNPNALAKNNICAVKLSTLFMNNGRLKVQMNFDLTGKDNAFNYKGELGSMNLKDINTATMPFAMVKITAGTLKRLTFDINASDKLSKGSVTLLYNDLKVRLLSPDTAMDGFKGKLIESLYANIFILKHNNPDNPGEAPRSFNVNYLRPKDSPFFKTMWQTLLSGIKPAVGLDEKTQKATKAKMSEHKKNKEERLQKRAVRKARRAAKEKQKELEAVKK